MLTFEQGIVHKGLTTVDVVVVKFLNLISSPLGPEFRLLDLPTDCEGALNAGVIVELGVFGRDELVE